MTSYQAKMILTGFLIILVSEIVKRHELVQGLIFSVPCISLMAIVWFYTSTKEPQRETGFTGSIFWLAAPALLFFLLFNMLQNLGYGFYMAYSASAIAMVIMYATLFQIMRKLRVRI